MMYYLSLLSSKLDDRVSSFTKRLPKARFNTKHIQFSADGRPRQQIKRKVGCHNASFIQLHSYFVGRLEPPLTLTTEISHCVKILVLHKSVKNHGLANKPVFVGIDAVGRAAIAAVWCI
eukprot:scaffold215114_cov74-Attheya_sp.AAC.1